MADWKFVTWSNGEFTHPIIFPGTFIHADVAKALPYLIPQAHREGGGIASAGMIPSLVAAGVGDRSSTLSLAPLEGDRTRINVYPYTAGARGEIDSQIEKMLMLKHIEFLMDIVRGN